MADVEEALDRMERKLSDTIQNEVENESGVTTPILEPFALNTRVWNNWSGTASCQPTYWHRPETRRQILEILEYAMAHEQNVHVVGSGRSPSDIACTDGHLISLERFNRILHIDRQKLLVKVEAGIIIETLNERLHESGLALRNLGSNSRVTLAGALSSGTHGSGIGYGILATDVVELELILANGSLVKCSRQQNQNIFLAALCSLGALGIICSVTLKCEPSFHMDAVQIPLPVQVVLADIKKIINSSEFVRIWWFPHTDKCIVWQANRSRRIDKTAALTSSSMLDSRNRQKLHDITHKLIGHYSLEFAYWMSSYQPKMIPYVNKLYQRLLYNKSTAEHDLSYKVFNSDCLFKGYVAEYAIPLENVYKALLMLKRMIDTKKYRAHFPVELKFVKGDDIWLSPAYGGDKACIST